MKKGPKPVGNYPHAKRAGKLLFMSGVGPRIAGSDANDSGVPGLELDHNGNFSSFDFEAQVHSVFANTQGHPQPEQLGIATGYHGISGPHEPRFPHV